MGLLLGAPKMLDGLPLRGLWDQPPKLSGRGDHVLKLRAAGELLIFSYRRSLLSFRGCYCQEPGGRNSFWLASSSGRARAVTLERGSGGEAEGKPVAMLDQEL